MKRIYKYIVGIDEAGRGPLAGPVTVAALALPLKLNIKNKKLKLPAKDSKKLSKRQRDFWFDCLKGDPNFVYAVANISEKIIDKIGITKAIESGVKKCIKKLETVRRSMSCSCKNSFIMLDGLLKAPKKYDQKTIIKGDEKIPVISAASIIAKVSRDRLMVRLSKKYPQYGFDRHKGYGTKFHYQMIKKYGTSKIHRKLFLRNLQAKTIDKI